MAMHRLFPHFLFVYHSPIASASLQPMTARSAYFTSPSRDPISWSGGRWTRRRIPLGLVMATSDSAAYKMNLNEYMVTLERPLGVRFALSLDGKVFVHSLRKGGNAERAKIIMVGDTLKKASDASGDGFKDIRNLNDAEKMLVDIVGTLNLILERPFAPYHIQQLHLDSDYDILFNKGKVPFATWNGTLLASRLHPFNRQFNTGFAIFSPRFLSPLGCKLLLSQDRKEGSEFKLQNNKNHTGEVAGICSEDDNGDVEWAFGSFPLEEYVKALERAKSEMYYNHSLGMQYSKITEQIYVGSCIQSGSDVQKFSNMGITAVLNFQSESERSNWGINSQPINDSCRNSNILMVNYPIREVDSVDLRKKLPFCVGLLLRLLRKNHRIYVTCTTGFDRSPACVIAYLHWIQDTALQAAYNFVTGLHTCRPDRPAIVWATWDLIAMVENEKIDGPPTHVVNFVWSNGCREGEEIYLVGDFTNNWKESVKASHKGGSRYEAQIRLRHGKYRYKFVVGGQWRHSTSLPTERDEHGNVNNVIRIGDVARIRPSPNELQIRDPTIVKVIERQLTEDERFMLAFAARRIAFAVCPINLAPK